MNVPKIFTLYRAALVKIMLKFSSIIYAYTFIKIVAPSLERYFLIVSYFMILFSCKENWLVPYVLYKF